MDNATIIKSIGNTLVFSSKLDTNSTTTMIRELESMSHRYNNIKICYSVEFGYVDAYFILLDYFNKVNYDVEFICRFTCDEIGLLLLLNINNPKVSVNFENLTVGIIRNFAYIIDARSLSNDKIKSESQSNVDYFYRNSIHFDELLNSGVISDEELNIYKIQKFIKVSAKRLTEIYNQYREYRRIKYFDIKSCNAKIAQLNKRRKKVKAIKSEMQDKYGEVTK